MSGLPTRGTLEEHPLPSLLLQLAAANATGTLRITAGGDRAEVLLAAGHPVRCEGGTAAPGVVEWLEERGELAADAAERARTTARAKDSAPEQALLGLKLATPQRIVEALRALTARRLVALGRHERGTFELEAGTALPAGAEALRADPLPIAQEIAEAVWRPDRMLGELMADTQGPVRLTESGRERAARLAPRDGVADLVAALEDGAGIWSALGSATRAGPIAALWVLVRTGSLEPAPAGAADTAPPEDATDAEAADGSVPAAPEPEIEIEIAGAAAETETADTTGTTANEAVGAADDAAAVLRAEILEKHDHLGEIDHYTLLGIGRDATAGQVKRAYLQAAKRFHPDALARLGLQDLKAEAGEVFAQIAKAQTALSDADSRRDYDAALDGHRAVDADQVAQAEILYRKGEMLMRAGNFREAVDYMEASTELWPEDPAYHAAFGWCLYKNHPPDEERAREHLTKALEIDAEFAEAHLRLGIVLKALGDKEGAARHTKRGKELDPNARA